MKVLFLPRKRVLVSWRGYLIVGGFFFGGDIKCLNLAIEGFNELRTVIS